jgi:hypothetical protein
MAAAELPLHPASRPSDSALVRGRASMGHFELTICSDSTHLDPTWVMGYDLDPLTCIAERKHFLARAIPERWLVLFTYAPRHARAQR